MDHPHYGVAALPNGIIGSADDLGGAAPGGKGLDALNSLAAKGSAPLHIG